MARMTGNRFIAETLAGYGVDHVFFVPAGTYRMLAAMEGLGIRRILAHAEKAAAYMADGYARASGRPGVVMAQASPGANNLAAGLGDPYVGVSPVIALTTARAPEERYRHAYQELDQMPFFGPVTKFSASVDRVDRIPDLLRQAFREVTTGTPRPAHLDILTDGADEEADLEVVVEDAFRRLPAFRPEPDASSVAAAANALAAAERPAIVAGGGVIASEAWAELVELAEKRSIPVATSLNGKGAIAASHPLSVGVCGLYSRSSANRVVGSADLVLFVGSQTGGQVTNSWTVPAIGTPVIQIDVEPQELGRNYPGTLGLLGDAKVTLRRLIDALRPGAPAEQWLSETRMAVEEYRSSAAGPRASDAVPLRPERVIAEMESALPDDTLLVSDTGHSGIWTGAMMDLDRSGRTYVRAAGSLGWGLPAAIGAKCAVPDRPVVCFTGDGGFWYHFGELETAARYGIDTVTVVNNNSSMNQETKGIEMAYDGDPPGYELMTFNDVDFARLAEDLGCFGVRVERPDQIRPALEAALACGRPAVVDVVTDRTVLPPPPLVP